MKKLFVLAAALCITTAAFSQAQFSIGIKAGPNFANIDTESSLGSNYDNRTGFHGGAFALLKFTKIGIQPEILFSQQGSKFVYNNKDVEANYNYFNIPVIVKLYTVAGINLQVGPQFGFVAGGEQKATDRATGVESTEEAKDVLKGSDISAALGVGWDLPFGLSLDARYNLGLSDVNKNSGAESIKNQVWQVSVGYKLFKFGDSK
jgi:hypothetical protein